MTKNQWGWTISLLILATGIALECSNEYRHKKIEDNKGYEVPDKSTGWDYNKSEWIVKKDGTIILPNHNLNEADIEEIRRNLPDNLYLHTPGRANGYRSTEEKIEQYIEDHYEELQEEFENN